MLNTVWAIVREGKIELLEHLELPEGRSVLVTLLPDEDSLFWLHASQPSLATTWDNAEDDVYVRLLAE